MNMQEMLAKTTEVFSSHLPSLLGALATLVVGWLAAMLLAMLVRKGLRRTTLDNRVAEWLLGREAAGKLELERLISQTIYLLLMLFVLVGFFQALGLTLLTEPLNRLLTEVFRFAPRIGAAALLLGIAWCVATLLRRLVAKVLESIKVDERLGGSAEVGQVPLAKTLSEAIYWLVFLLFLPAVLHSLQLEGLMVPVQGMLNRVLAILPNLFAAGLILAAGWFLARIVQRVVTNLLVTVGADRFSERVGLASLLGKGQLSGLLGIVLYVLILIPVLVAALNTLGLEAITRPASNMLNSILAALPALFAATLVLAVAYAVGRLIAGLVTNVLGAAGFNGILFRLGLSKEPSQDEKKPAETAGHLALVAVMLFAAIEACQLLGFGVLADMLSRFVVFFGQILLGLVIFGVGLYLAGVTSRTLLASGYTHASLLASAGRIAITVLAAAMGLQQMGLAKDIVNWSFALVLGGIVLSLALAFGLGGRETAGRELDQWIQSIRRK